MMKLTLITLLSCFFLLISLSTPSQAKWERVFEGDGDTELRAIAFPSVGEGWAGGSDGILYRTSDDGRRWRKQIVKDIPRDYKIYDLFFLDDRTGWAIANFQQDFPLVIEGLILHTVDGNQWQKQYQNQSAVLSFLSFFDSKEGFVRAGIRINDTWKGKLLHTIDSGKTWTQTNAFPAEPYGRIHFFDHFRWWFLGQDGKVYHTFDAGKSWQSFPTPEQSIGQIYFVDSQIGWVAQQTHAFGFPPFRKNSIYRTKNGGMSWDFLLETDFGASIYFLNDQEGWIVGTKWETRNVVNGIILHTSDGGMTWDKEVLTGEILRKIVSDSERLWIRTSRSIYRQSEYLGVTPKGKLVTTWGKIKSALPD